MSNISRGSIWETDRIFAFGLPYRSKEPEAEPPPQAHTLPYPLLALLSEKGALESMLGHSLSLLGALCNDFRDDCTIFASDLDGNLLWKVKFIK